MIMARKMTSEEERVFNDAMADRADMPAGEGDLLENLDAKRDAAMLLTPELDAWFDFELSARSGP